MAEEANKERDWNHIIRGKFKEVLNDEVALQDLAKKWDRSIEETIERKEKIYDLKKDADQS